MPHNNAMQPIVLLSHPPTESQQIAVTKQNAMAKKYYEVPTLAYTLNMKGPSLQTRGCRLSQAKLIKTATYRIDQ